MISQAYAALGYEQITSTATAFKLGAIPPGANYALIQTEAQNVRWRDDGIAPTATVGMLMQTTDKPLEYSGPLANIQLIAAVSGAIVDVSFYKTGG